MSRQTPQLNISHEPSLKPASDEVAVYRSKHKKSSQDHHSGNSTPPATTVIGVKSTWGLRTLMTLVVVLLVGLSVGIIWPLKQQLDGANKALKTLESQLNALNLQLERTGSNADRSGKTIQARIGELDFEIRKLWDLANKRNRRDISTLNQTLKSQTDNQSQMQQGIEKLKQASQTQTKTLQSSTAELSQLTSRLKTIETSFEDQLLRLNQEQQQLKTNLAQTTKALSENPSIDTLLKRLSENEQAIAAIDTYRRQVNTTLAQLKASVSTLQNKQN